MKNSIYVIILFTFVSNILTTCAKKETSAVELVVYSVMEADNLKRYGAAFNEDHPNIKIRWVRDSTGIITAKLLAEKEKPQADAIWGLAGTSLMLLKSEGMLEPYAPAGVEKLDKKFTDKTNPSSWAGMYAWVAAVCFNTIEAKKHNLPPPVSWKDLAKPIYKGHVVMPNPNSSGTGFLDVSSWIQLYGEQDAWQFMDDLHNNIAWYTHSGSKPCKQAASGETVIGVSFAFRGAKSKAAGAPLKIIIPSEGVGWEMETAAILKGSDKIEAAKKLMDWAISRKANEMYSNDYAVVGYPGLAKEVPHFPKETLGAMIDYDFEFSAKNRQAILSKWQTRYDSKSEPKKKK